jgi:hypothetical protein
MGSLGCRKTAVNEPDVAEWYRPCSLGRERRNGQKNRQKSATLQASQAYDEGAIPFTRSNASRPGDRLI